MWAFSVVCGLLMVVASLIVEHMLYSVDFSHCGLWALWCLLSSCRACAQNLHRTWDLPGPGAEPVSPALAGGSLATRAPREALEPSFVQCVLSPDSVLEPWALLIYISELLLFLN